MQRLLRLLIISSLAVASCGSEAAENTSSTTTTSTTSTTSTTTASTTTSAKATSTTAATTTTTSTPASTTNTGPTTTVGQLADAEPVRQLYLDYYETSIDERVAGYEAEIPLIEKYTTNPLKTRMIELIDTRKKSGQFLAYPSSDIDIIDVQVDEVEGTALVVACVTDFGKIYNRVGEEIASDPADPEIKNGVYLKLGDSWLLSDVRRNGGPCTHTEP